MQEFVLLQQSKSFFGKNIVYIVVLCFLCKLGINNKTALTLAIVDIVIAMTFSSIEHKFCWSLFLVPNIRLFDCMGTESIVNVLFVIPLVFYVFRINKKMTIFPMMGALSLFLLEILHRLSAGAVFWDLIGWILAFLWCAYATLDENIHVDKNDATYALVAGIIFSGVIFLINNPNMANGLVLKVLAGHRFEAYANDPNYFSTYICLAFSALVIKKRVRIIDYFLMLILLLFALLTTSKMCIILIIVDIIYFVAGTFKDSSKLLKNVITIFVFCLIVYLMRDFIRIFLEKLIDRAGGNRVTIDTLTSNRFSIVTDYLKILSNDVFTFLFGRGFSYNDVLKTTETYLAHNTYLDIVLSWGIIGAFAFSYVMHVWYEKYRERLKKEKISYQNKLPLITLLLSFFSLSSFNAGMFYFIIAYSMIQMRYSLDENNKS